MTSPEQPSPEAADVAIAMGPAYGVWASGWMLGVIASPLVIVAVGATLGDDLTVPQLGALLLVTWAIMLAALTFGSRKFGTGNFIGDLAVYFRPIDVVAVPVGVATQLVVLQVLYAPLRSAWPDVFSTEDVEERARTLVDSASGGWLVVLFVLLVAGAPVIEELAYRGLIQRSTTPVIGPMLALVGTSALFAIVHFVPVEYPGLFVAGLVFGGCLLWTGRVGTAIVAHASFNAAGVITALASS